MTPGIFWIHKVQPPQCDVSKVEYADDAMHFHKVEGRREHFLNANSEYILLCQGRSEKIIQELLVPEKVLALTQLCYSHH